ncbi:DUF3560 domain-containing protein [Pseudoclavibacter sp. AY1H1]|uniref:DUF3560 domain-containing protein n=1 Tax=Pseudoclavibacter sp. AY1H1 TaxID=2080584 RepID=UPI000CE81743|nr:DUF3560 domain-containing protein [Pseudoclavibacter sp. AY1H1]PPF32611.1 hypothetical protein C5E05_19090 [Pseudoclavibacter sp. AY1H1]
MITITHTHEAGTTAAGTNRGDGTADIFKREGWRWGRSISCWYLPHSRDKVANRYRIKDAARALEAAGRQVTLTVDDTARPAAQVEADRAARQAHRVTGLTTRAAHLAEIEKSADARLEVAKQSVPPMGQPILVGHHSESKHRRSIDKLDKAMRQSIDAGLNAQRGEQAAATAAKTTEHRYSPITVANRIENIEKEIRSVERLLNGYRRAPGTPYAEDVPPATGEVRDQLLNRRNIESDALTYWQQIRADQVADGATTNYQASDIAKGDEVLYRGSWYEVARVNEKTVSVLVRPGSTVTHTIAYAKLRDHRAADTSPLSS